jgi:hypothetical protein
MKYVDEYRDGVRARAIAAAIAAEVQSDRTYAFMEFCGGHTHAISRYGIEDLLPANLHMIHGPGCPVCVFRQGSLRPGFPARTPSGRNHPQGNPVDDQLRPRRHRFGRRNGEAEQQRLRIDGRRNPDFDHHTRDTGDALPSGAVHHQIGDTRAQG